MLRSVSSVEAASRKVRDFALRHDLRDVKCLPYQPLDQLSNALSVADLHVAVMGDAFVGIVHPCKIYSIMAVGAPSRNENCGRP